MEGFAGTTKYTVPYPEFLQKFIALADGTRRIEVIRTGKKGGEPGEPIPFHTSLISLVNQ
jgi:hypothetical protein